MPARPAFQHFILTRFNLRRAGWTSTRDKQQMLTDQWMQNRLGLFENYCYASLRGQTELNFQWLVFFDSSTASGFRDKISQLHQNFANFIPFYIDGMPQFWPTIKRELQARRQAPHIITTRLDNDDCLHQDFVAHIQAQFCQQDFELIDLVDGYTLQIEPQIRLGLREQTNNPFQSLIERSEQAQSIWQRERHGQWSKQNEVRYVRNKRLWMSVIHGNNKANDFAGFGSVDTSVLEGFNLPTQIHQTLGQNALPTLHWRWTSRLNHRRTQIKIALKFLKRRLRGLSVRVIS